MVTTRYLSLVEALYAAPPDRRFVTSWIDEDEQETATFGEFRRRSESQAVLLQQNGVRAGDRVILIMPQRILLMAVFAGCMRLGAVPAILAYPNFKVEASKYRFGLAGVTANLRARLIVVDDEFPDDLLEHITLSDEARVLRAADAGAFAPGALPEPGFAPNSLAFIQHSAGTTGLQKGVALTHAAVLRHLEHLSSVLQIDPQTDSAYSWLPLYHDMGLIACFMLPMVCHFPIVMQSPVDWVMHPEIMLQIFSAHRCTLSWMPNFAFQFVARRTPRERRSSYDLSSVRALINCSEPVRASSMNEFYRAFESCGLKRSALQSSYAMAENVFAVTQSGIDDADGLKTIRADGQRFRGEHVIVQVPEGTPEGLSFTSSGRLLPCNEVRIVSDVGDILDAGSVGEIVIRSDSLFQSYFNRPDLTEKVLRDGWFYTGDLGFLLNGELFIVGRKKDLLIIGGENIYPQDIEEIVYSHPSIHDGRAIALGLFNPELGTEDIVVIAEVEDERHLQRTLEIEGEIRGSVVAGTGVAVRRVFVKPPKWIVKSTAGKPARSTTREKLLREHPELIAKTEETQNDS
jgi:fatty-acyl-CoA synthase